MIGHLKQEIIDALRHMSQFVWNSRSPVSQFIAKSHLVGKRLPGTSANVGKRSLSRALRRAPRSRRAIVRDPGIVGCTPIRWNREPSDFVTRKPVKTVEQPVGSASRTASGTERDVAGDMRLNHGHLPAECIPGRHRRWHMIGTKNMRDRHPRLGVIGTGE
jgi:hypothetical protein